MISTAVEKLTCELKNAPFTLIVMLCLIGYAVYSSNNHAKAEDVKELNATVDQILILQIVETLPTLQKQLCAARDAETQRVLRQTIEELQNKYRRITGARYELKRCG